MITRSFTSWGRLGAARAAAVEPAWLDEIELGPAPRLAYGLGRSYGDSCLLDGGTMIDTRHLDRLVRFDPETGLLSAEAGITLDAILRFCVPRGWFLPTTPGTREVTLGGAIANDVHGKNHHRVGCFGNHVPRLELMRSDGSRTITSSGEELHAATVGGLGLTGLITRAEVQLVPIHSASLDVELIRFEHLDEFAALSTESADGWEHTVAWIDCLARAEHVGRGIFIRGNWADSGDLQPHAEGGPTVPVDFPGFALNPLSIRLFNQTYHNRFPGKSKRLVQHYSPFFHPLDSVHEWNRIYGKRGFYQYQSVVPAAAGIEPVRAMLEAIAAARQGSFLAVLKSFGGVASPGMLSFPLAGLTLALDFPNRGRRTLDLFSQLDRIVREAGGRLYPAKDARMSAADFTAGYPRLEEFRRHVDPGFSSDFWKRMNP